MKFRDIKNTMNDHKFEDGDKVYLSTEMAGTNKDRQVRFTVSQNEPDKKRCWVGSGKHNLGWYVDYSDIRKSKPKFRV